MTNSRINSKIYVTRLEPDISKSIIELMEDKMRRGKVPDVIKALNESTEEMIILKN